MKKSSFKLHLILVFQKFFLSKINISSKQLGIKKTMRRIIMKTINLKKIAFAGAALIGLGTAAITTVSQNSEPTIVQAASNKIKISQNTAVKKFRTKYKNAKIESINLEKERGRYVYEIEGFDSTHEYSAEINAETGHASSVHSEKLDHDDQNETALNLDGIISRNEASSIAEKHAKGKSYEWKLENEHGKTYWDVEVKDGHRNSEVKIDAHSKKVISVENDD